MTLINNDFFDAMALAKVIQSKIDDENTIHFLGGATTIKKLYFDENMADDDVISSLKVDERFNDYPKLREILLVLMHIGKALNGSKINMALQDIKRKLKNAKAAKENKLVISILNSEKKRAEVELKAEASKEVLSKKASFKQMLLADSTDWDAPKAKEKFVELNTKYHYFEKDNNEPDIQLFTALTKLCRARIVFVEQNNTENDTMAYDYAYKMMVLFYQSEKMDMSVSDWLKYISSEVDKLTNTLGNKNEKKCYHDIFITALSALPLKEDLQDREAWIKLIQKIGVKALPAFLTAKKIASINNNQVPSSLEEVNSLLAKCSYDRANEDFEFALMCQKYHVLEETFDACLDFMATSWPKKKTDNLPDISISHGKYKWFKLPPDDKRALILGEITDCCQSINGHSEACVIDLVSLANNGVYVLTDGDKIIGQAYAWLSNTNNLCLDSLEMLGSNDADQNISPLKPEDFQNAELRNKALKTEIFKLYQGLYRPLMVLDERDEKIQNTREQIEELYANVDVFDRVLSQNSNLIDDYFTNYGCFYTRLQSANKMLDGLSIRHMEFFDEIATLNSKLTEINNKLSNFQKNHISAPHIKTQMIAERQLRREELANVIKAEKSIVTVKDTPLPKSQNASNISRDNLKQILEKFADEAFKYDKRIKRVTLGIGGKTPKNLYPNIPNWPESMRQGRNYGDATKQCLIKRRELIFLDKSQAEMWQKFLRFKSKKLVDCIEYLLEQVDDLSNSFEIMKNTVLNVGYFESLLKHENLKKFIVYSPVVKLENLAPISFSQMAQLSKEEIEQLPAGRLLWCSTAENIYNVFPLVSRQAKTDLLRGSEVLFWMLVEHKGEILKFLHQINTESRLDALVKQEADSGKTILHYFAHDFEMLGAMLALIPPKQHRAVLDVVDHQGHSIMFYSAKNHQSLSLLLELCPKEKCYDAITELGSDRQALIHVAATNVQLLAVISKYIAPDEMPSILKIRSFLEITPLDLSIKNVDAFKWMAQYFPDEELKNLKYLDSALDNPDSFYFLWSRYSENERKQVLQEINHYGHTLLQAASMRREPTAFKTVLSVIPLEQRINKLIEIMPNYGQFLWDEKNDYRFMQEILALLPKESHRKLLTIKIKDHNKLLSLPEKAQKNNKLYDAIRKNFDDIDDLLPSPIFQELEENIRTSSRLSLSNLVSDLAKMQEIFNHPMKQEYLISLLKMQNRAGDTLLEASTSHPHTFKFFIQLLPPYERVQCLNKHWHVCQMFRENFADEFKAVLTELLNEKKIAIADLESMLRNIQTYDKENREPDHSAIFKRGLSVLDDLILNARIESMILSLNEPYIFATWQSLNKHEDNLSPIQKCKKILYMLVAQTQEASYSFFSGYASSCLQCLQILNSPEHTSLKMLLKPKGDLTISDLQSFGTTEIDKEFDDYPENKSST